MELEQTLVNLERGFWTGDAAFYRERLTPEAVMTFPDPVGIMTRDSIIDSIEQAPRWSEVSLTEVHVVPLSFGSVALVYRAHASRKGGGAAYAALCSSAYIKRDGGWLLATHQQTPVS